MLPGFAPSKEGALFQPIWPALIIGLFGSNKVVLVVITMRVMMIIKQISIWQILTMYQALC